MLISISLVLMVGMFLGISCKKIRLPALVGMIATGIIFGPHMLNIIDPKLLSISSELRRIALIIILMRAGLSLNISGLKQVGRSAILMCFVPATLEILGYVLIAPCFLGVSRLEAAIIGAVLAAVSPAVIVPRMIKLSEEGYGTKKQIPQMILAGASVDDVFVIVIFSTFIGMAQGQGIDAMQLVRIPCSIVFGIGAGLSAGLSLGIFFKKIHMRDSAKVLILLSIAFALDYLESEFGKTVPFSGLIAVMAMGIGLQKNRKEATVRLSAKFSKLWVCAEIVLFVLVGACVDITYARSAGIPTLIVILLVLLFRTAGVCLCVVGTDLNFKEKIFCTFSYIPKATVQAAIGGIPLALGLGCGNIVLTVAVMGILITAPLGAALIDLFYKRMLAKD
ncbi:cation:proton antiporter [Treponema sp.]|uniref:cation:proton antiporter n=1 Tax=Treponema sp. TaxID=166 RepID=UPI00298EB7FC|nr:cation:proton antiporter [Treponema sp.]MCQ2240654.1 cation:proton antiporter [Treponema sp.]